MCPRLWIFDSYSLFIFLGLIIAVLVFEWYGHIEKARRLEMSIIEIVALLCVAAGFAGGLLFQNLYDYLYDPTNYVWSNKMTFFGGLAFAILLFALCYAVYLRKTVKRTLLTMLTIVPGCLAGAHACGRLGCFMAGCCYGVPTSSWIGIRFPMMDEAVIPTNLMEAIFLFLLSIVLIYWAYKRKTNLTIPTYMLSYGLWRFIIEFYRGDERGSLIRGLSPSQFWSIILFIGGIAVLIGLLRANRRNPNPGTYPRQK